MIGLIMIFIFFYGAEAGRDYRSGRWSLLLGSPLPGWMQMGSRVLFAFLAITLFSALMLGLMHIMLIKPMGIVIPLGFYLSLWLYGLGGLPLILFGLFGTLFTTAYLPRKTQNIAGFVAVLGSGSLLALLSQLLSKIMFSLPPWIIPMPTVDGVPIDFKDSDVQFGNHLPTEGFVALLLISALLFYATSRMWTEVEA